ncbi:MAG: hypothetical protein KC800_06705 [Candidatus Eremiobacteraeota bacterium]|nr:hypothetical protein [Candidatus Eremiobacteraeota bacterium]
MASLILTSSAFLTLFVFSTVLLSLSAACKTQGRDGLVKGTLGSALILLTYSPMGMTENFSELRPLPSLPLLFAFTFISATVLEFLRSGKTLRGFLFERRVRKGGLATVLRDLLAGIVVGGLSLLAFVSVSLLQMTENFYRDPAVEFQTRLLLTIGIAAVTAFSGVLGSLLWPHNWRAPRVIFAQVFLTVSIVFFTAYSTLYWNNFMASNESVSLNGFDGNGGLLVEFEDRANHLLRDRTWRVLGSDGDVQRLDNLRREQSSNRLFTSFVTATPHEYQFELVNNKTGETVYKDYGPPDVIEGTSLALYPSEDGPVLIGNERSKVFPSEYRYRGATRNQLIFSLRNERKTVVLVDPQTLTEEVLLEGVDFETIVVSGERFFFSHRDELWVYSLQSAGSSKLASLANGDTLIPSPSGDRLLYLDQARQIRVLDVQTLESQMVGEKPASKETLDISWLSEDVVEVDSISGKTLYFLEEGRKLGLADEVDAVLLHPSNGTLYILTDSCELRILDLEGRQLKAVGLRSLR